VALVRAGALLLLSLPALGQTQTGNLFGTVVDSQGQPLPGATVTISGIGTPRVQVTNAQGGFRFLDLTPSGYQLKAELEGFSTLEYPNITIRAGRNTTIEVTLSPAVEDIITVTNESPLLDERRIATGNTVTENDLEKIPTARDPWVILQPTPGVLTNDSKTVGDGGEDTPLLMGPHFELKATLDNGALRGFFLEETGSAIELYGFEKDLDSFPAPGVNRVTRFAPGSFAGPPAICPDGRGFFQDLSNFGLRELDVDFDDPSDLPPLIGGIFPNSVFTGGHQPSALCRGGTVYALSEEGTPGGTTTPTCPSPFYSSSRLKVYEIRNHAVQDFTILEHRPGPHGPGCYTGPVLGTGAVDTGGCMGFLYRDGQTLQFRSVEGELARSFDLPSGYDDVLISLDPENDRQAGVSRVSLPFCILELYDDGLAAGGSGFDIVPTNVRSGDGVEAIEPRVASEIFTTSLSSRRESSYLLGNFAFEDGVPVLGDRAASAATVVRPAIVPLAGCVDTDRTFCGLGNRFSVKVDWQLQDGTRRRAHARPLSGDSGTFWFLSKDNRELLVKTLDGCGLNGHYWFFAAGLTDLRVDISVQDTHEHRGRHYSSTGTFQPILDTTAFPCPGGGAAAAAPGAQRRVRASARVPAANTDPPGGAPCGGGSGEICLRDERFRVTARWNLANGQTGPAVGGRLADDSGVFHFFDADNYELAVKVLRGCGVNDRYWVFAAGLTDVGVEITVTDTRDGLQKKYRRLPGTPFAPITDTSAFATCP
jgi:hypothetical protein